MPNVGPMELAIVLIIALLVLGPKKLPEVGRSIGKGMREFGAPNLTDADWLYGGDKDTIVATITNARYGVMPTWEARLDAPTINALAVYVHSLGGGE